MDAKRNRFHADSERVAFDREHRRILKHNIGQYDKAVERGRSFFRDLDAARDLASGIKDYVQRDFENLLLKFEKQAIANGCEVEWASGTEDVKNILGKIIAGSGVRTAVKMKSMVTEETEINHFLEESGVESFETDLGEFIVQLAGEKPYHILTPAMHKSKESVAALFHEKFNLREGARPEEVTLFVRNFLRDKFMKAQLGITGANFLIADTGSVGLTENEGNGMMTFSWPKTLVVIAGIEKIIPRFTDLALFWPLLAVYGTGQHVTAYNSILSGPIKPGERDGPERMVIILLDGGRTNVYADPEMRLALRCIRCGACLNACPVYRNVGGHTYGTTYTGPIGSVLSMYMDDSRDAGFLNFASSLCGKCTEVCPVRIPLHHLLLINRRKYVETNGTPFTERMFFKGYRHVMMKRRRLDRIPANLKNRVFKTVGQRVWGPRREPLVFARESFRESWIRKERPILSSTTSGTREPGTGNRRRSR